jgi:integrase
LITRTRYQYGSLQMKARTSGEMVWELRYYETDSHGQRQRRSATVGTVAQHPTESAIRKSSEVQALLLRINAEAVAPNVAP